MTAAVPLREGMMAAVRNRRALIVGVQPFDADEQSGAVASPLPSRGPTPGTLKPAERQRKLFE